MSYTKGPWRVGVLCMEETKFKGPYIDILAGGSLPFALQPAIVAGRDTEETEANARLIAASPELLEALEEITSAYEDSLACFGPEHENIYISHARKIIAKAKAKNEK